LTIMTDSHKPEPDPMEPLDRARQEAAAEPEPEMPKHPEVERVEDELPGGFKAAGGLADQIRPPHFHYPGH
jgi:hypothetical protein